MRVMNRLKMGVKKRVKMGVKSGSEGDEEAHYWLAGKPWSD